MDDEAGCEPGAREFPSDVQRVNVTQDPGGFHSRYAADPRSNATPELPAAVQKGPSTRLAFTCRPNGEWSMVGTRERMFGTGQADASGVESGGQRDGRTVAYPVGETRYRYEESPSSATQGSG